MIVSYFGRVYELPEGHSAVCTDADGGVYSTLDREPSFNGKVGTWCSPCFKAFELIDTRDDLDAAQSLILYNIRQN